MKAVLVLAVAFTNLGSSAGAEAVRLQVAGRSVTTGQGWLFRDPKSGFCGVVTAAHVIAPEGMPAPVTIIARDGIEGVGRGVQILSPAPPEGQSTKDALDVAIMAVDGTILRRGCTTATLGTPGVRFLLSKSRNGVLVTVVDTDATMQNVEILGAAQEDDRLLSLRFAREKDEIEQGVSGAVVTEREDQRVSEGLRPLPLAMVTRVEGTIARAVRFDAVKGLADEAIAHWRTIPVEPRPRVIGWDGTTKDPSCPATGALTPDACGWLVGARTGQKKVSLVIAIGGVDVSRVRVRTTAVVTGRRVVLESSASDAGNDWTFAKAGTLIKDEVQLRMATTRAERLRLTIEAGSDERLEVKADLN